jgi:high affinity sulfate transporter 1
MSAAPATPRTGWAALRGYRRADFPHDLTAGLALAAVTVPTAIAHAQLAGLNVAAGLYASMLPLLVYAVMGSSPQLMLGTGAGSAAIVAAAVAPLAGDDAALYQTLAVALTALAGLLCLGAAKLRLGALADFLSRPIIIGYLNGIALAVVLAQLGPLFGYRIEAGGILPRLAEFVRGLPQTHVPTLAVGTASFALLWLGPRLLPRVPAALLVALAAIAAAYALDLREAGVALLGPVPAGLPVPSWPAVPLALLPTLLAEAGGLALLSFSTMMLAARSFADRNRYDIDADRELAALGAANLAAAVAQGFAVSGTNARTAVAAAAGARTQMTGVFAAAAVLGVLLFFTAPLEYLPRAAVAAILVHAGLTLINVAELRLIRRIDPQEFWIALIALVGVLLLGPVNAILLVVVLALLRFVKLKARPAVETLGRLAGQPGFVARERHPEAVVEPGLLLLRCNGPIVFFSAPHFKRMALQAAEQAGPDLRWFVLDLLPVSSVDITGLYALRDTFAALRARGVQVGVAYRASEWAEWAQQRGLEYALQDIRFFATLRQAHAAYRKSEPALG